MSNPASSGKPSASASESTDHELPAHRACNQGVLPASDAPSLPTYGPMNIAYSVTSSYTTTSETSLPLFYTPLRDKPPQLLLPSSGTPKWGDERKPLTELVGWGSSPSSTPCPANTHMLESVEASSSPTFPLDKRKMNKVLPDVKGPREGPPISTSSLKNIVMDATETETKKPEIKRKKLRLDGDILRPSDPNEKKKLSKAVSILERLQADLDAFAKNSSNSRTEKDPDDAGLELNKWEMPPVTIPGAPQTKTPVTEFQAVALDDDDEFWEKFESEICEAADTCALDTSATAGKPAPKRLCVTRYTVLFADPRPVEGALPRNVHVLCGTQRLSLTLYAPWRDLDFRPGHIVHIVETHPATATTTAITTATAGIFSSIALIPPPTVIDAHQHLLVLHPDVLVTGSAASESHECLRRSILKARVYVKDGNLAALLGTLSHDFLQRLLFNNVPKLPVLPSTEQVAALMDHVIQEYELELHLLGDTTENAKEQLRLVYQHYVSTLYPTFTHQPNHTQSHPPKASPTFPIEQILDIEENVWAPTFGLKGKLDATLQVRTSPQTRAYVPMEIKAGKRRMISHHAQTILYTLLLAEKYPLDERADLGILFNVTTNEMLTVTAKHAELRDLLMLRNQYAAAMRAHFDLPPMLRQPGTCERCYANTTCFLYHKATERGTETTANVSPIVFNEKTGHLTSHHVQFLKTWSDLINLEASVSSHSMVHLWRPDPPPSSSSLSAWLNLTLVSATLPSANFSEPFRVIFQSEAIPETKQLPFQTGDLVMISQMAGPYCISTGFVTAIDGTSVTLQLDRPFRQPLHATGKYRLDSASTSNTFMASMRYYLFALFTPPIHPLRELIVDLRPPRFHSLKAVIQKDPPIQTVLQQSAAVLNDSQQAILVRAMCMRDYTLVVGMPGTGKSTVLSHLLAALVRLGKTTLLTSHTHSAVDTVLLKLHALAPDVPFLRVGALDRVHPDLHAFTPHRRAHTELLSARLVAATALGVQHPLVARRRFDLCVVDEATQLLLPATLGPLHLADRFVLVGDPYQLPPVVRHPEARALEQSLFARLLAAHPHAMAVLDLQYRMAAPIMHLANTFVYHHLLALAVPAAHAPGTELALPAPAAAATWTERVCTFPVLFLNTQHRETQCPTGTFNTGQIQLIQQLLPFFPADTLSILTPYRAQLAKLQEAIPNVEVCTIDQYQGRDKPIIILSLVRCNEGGHVGDLLRDWRRINVAFTRARVKLIIIGCAKTLSHSLLWNTLLTYFRAHSHVIDL